MTLLLLLARLLLSIVFLVAGLAKLADLAGSRQAMRDFGVPNKLADVFGLLLPLDEIAAAVAVLVDAQSKIASELAAGAPAVLELAGQKQAQVRAVSDLRR
jgi:uncharacterized membrane protein YphA (DoxX/SURF4 family)